MSTWKEEKQIKRPLLYLTGGLVLGETMALWIAGKGVLFGLALAPAVFLLLCRKRCTGRSFFGFLVIITGWLLGILCMEATETRLLKTESMALKLAAESGKTELVLEGILKKSEEGTGGDKWVLAGCKVTGRKGRPAESTYTVSLPGKVLCYVDGGGVPAGSRVQVAGSIRIIKPPVNPGEYNYRHSCFSQGIGCQFYGEKIFVLEEGRWTLSEYLKGVRRRLGERLDAAAEQKDAGILKAVLLGERKDLDQGIYDLYRKNGISHLLAISGLHMSVLGMGFWKLLRKTGCGRGASGFLAGSMLILYGTMTGFSPSVFRAIFMLLLSFMADWLGRTYDLASALCAAAFCLLVTEPFLLTQAAFQLSFLAVGGIVFLGQPLIRYVPLKNHPLSRPVFEAFLVSFSVQMSTLPAILYHSFEIPVYSIFLNLLVIPPMAGVLYSGLAAMAFAGASRSLAVFCLGGGHFILWFYEWICRSVQKLPGAVWCAGRPQMWQILLFYVLILGGVKSLEKAERPDRKKRNQGIRAAGVCVFWCSAFLFLIPVERGGLTVVFLDVGQGDGIFLEQEGWNLLVDCGSSQNKNLGEYSLVPFLKSRGITSLDTVVITHGDKDHISGIQYLLENPETGIRMKQLLMPEAGKGEEIYEKLEEQAGRNGIQTVYIGRGDRIAASGGVEMEEMKEKTGNMGVNKGRGEPQIECLYPSEETRCRDRNDQSAVLLLTYGRFRLLLTGDLEAAGERELIERGELMPVTILKAGHHGSATSSGMEFLEEVSPAETILSYGEGNRYGHPDRQVVARLKECGSGIWETAKAGAIAVWTDGERVKIQGFLKESGK